VLIFDPESSQQTVEENTKTIATPNKSSKGCISKSEISEQQDRKYVLNPNWYETGRIYLPYNFRIEFCQLNF
jgi:hypothetical protein